MSKAQWTVPVENYYQKEVVRRSVEDGTAFNAAYAIMNALAAVVASYGLLEDSPAVVIGAMVIATFLGPITGLALALGDGETALLRRALLAELAGGAIVLSIAFLQAVGNQAQPRQLLTIDPCRRVNPGRSASAIRRRSEALHFPKSLRALMSRARMQITELPILANEIRV